MPCSSISFEKRIAELTSSTSSAAKNPPDPKMGKASIAAAETSELSSSPSPQPSTGNEGERVKRKGRAACAACKQMHDLFDCKEFKEMSPVKRKKFCYSERICFRCVNSRTHPSFKCPMELQCHCGSKSHHRLVKGMGSLCPEKKGRTGKRKSEGRRKRSRKGEGRKAKENCYSLF